jgi:hypothetical protein
MLVFSGYGNNKIVPSAVSWAHWLMSRFERIRCGHEAAIKAGGEMDVKLSSLRHTFLVKRRITRRVAVDKHY